MNQEIEPLWLHAYSGRENGLMVIGDAATLKSLAEHLLVGVQSSTSAKESFPPRVVTPKVIGPYKDVPDFTLSFHLPGSVPLSQVVPLRRRNLFAPVFLCIAACAIVGAITIVRWVLAHAL